MIPKTWTKRARNRSGNHENTKWRNTEQTKAVGWQRFTCFVKNVFSVFTERYRFVAQALVGRRLGRHGVPQSGDGGGLRTTCNDEKEDTHQNRY